jgi:hypothetical protein
MGARFMSQQDIILITAAGSLVCVLVGALINSLTTRAVERQRWRHERQEKLASLRRDAIAAALEWIEPMRNAHSRASSLVMAAVRGEIEDEHLLKEWPNLLGVLVKKDLPGKLRAVLPDDTYERGHRIHGDLEELSYLGVKYGQEARVMGRPMAGYQECSAKLDAVQAQIWRLETDLRKAFQTTFE